MKVTLAHLQRSVFPYHVSLTSSIPQGKGMASSSADVAAVIQAVACACGTVLSEQEVGYLAARVDPVDGVFARGLSLISTAAAILSVPMRRSLPSGLPYWIRAERWIHRPFTGSGMILCRFIRLRPCRHSRSLMRA